MIGTELGFLFCFLAGRFGQRYTSLHFVNKSEAGGEIDCRLNLFIQFLLEVFFSFLNLLLTLYTAYFASATACK